jgi:hypothetical protein
MTKQLHSRSDRGDSGSRKCKRGYDGAYGDVWRGLGFGFNRCEDVYTFDLVIEQFYKCYSFNAICKNNPAINCVAVQYRKGSFPPILKGHNTLLISW